MAQGDSSLKKKNSGNRASENELSDNQGNGLMRSEEELQQLLLSSLKNDVARLLLTLEDVC